jgi:AcrR family transcriptional regulator
MSQTFESVEHAGRDTKERILDAAELLFATNGFDATSLRQITSEANANLAAVNYHFQTKEALTRAVLARRLEPINRRRFQLLDALEFAAGDGAVELEDIIRAFILPVMEAKEAKPHNPGMARLMGRLISEPGGVFMQMFKEEMVTAVARFSAAFAKSCPHIPQLEVMWGMHFGIGSMAHFLISRELLQFLTGGQADAEDFPAATDRLVRFIAGGMRAMTAQTKEAAR